VTGTLDEAYRRLHVTGPEFGGWLSNHGPMAAEAMVRGGAGRPGAGLPDPPSGPQAAAETFARAVAHGDEHVIKFADTAADVYARTGNSDVLAAAIRATQLISR
jgi:hypothetical protein